MEILVIGTEPPCVRCLTTYRRAKEVTQQFSEKIEVRKVVIHSEEAARYGKIESGGGIAEAANVRRDTDKMKLLTGEISKLIADQHYDEYLIESKLKEVDNVLLPVKEKAKELGYLMTPVLIVNGRVKSMDYVPAKEQIQAWIEIERRR